MDSILVTGGAGFIGSWVARTLVESGKNVVCFDDFSSGHERNIKDLLGKKNFKLVKGDVRDLALVEKTIKENGITGITHQAAKGSVPRSIKEPVLTNEVNVNGTLNILWAAHKHGVKRVVVAISSSVYGDSKVLPKKEDMPYNPKSPYAISKVTKDMYIKNFYELYGLETVGLRYFNVYGPNQDPEGPYAAVIPRFIRNALKNEQIVIYGDGEQTRDFTYVMDVVSANLNSLTSKDAPGKSMNIAYGSSISVKELAQRVIKVTGSKSTIRFEEERKGDVKHSIADVSLARKSIGFNPKFGIDEGLNITAEWFRKNI